MFPPASKHMVSFVHDAYLFFSKNATVCNEIFAIALIDIILFVYYSISVIFPKAVRFIISLRFG
jgi:hypothetical protein